MNLNDPRGSGLPVRVYRYLLGKARRATKRYATARMERMGLVGLFDARPPDAKPPDWSDLLYLYRLVRRTRPDVVLEFGSGCSTIVFAQALHENRREGQPGFLHSMEGSEHWAEVTRATIPDHLREVVEVITAPVREVEVAGVKGWRYTNVPDVRPGVVYVDGPSLTPDRRVAVDVLDLEPELPEDVHVVVDGRPEQCAFFEENLEGRWVRKENVLLFNTVFRRAGAERR